MGKRRHPQFWQCWQLVAEAEREELRREPMEVKFRQLAALMQSALALGWETSDGDEPGATCPRWQRLREALRE